MKTYSCDICESLVYFENTQCLTCNSELGYLPNLDSISSIERIDDVRWKALTSRAENAIYKKCQNYHLEKICNWMVPIDSPSDFCVSCNLNETIPNLEVKENRGYWHKLEIAKRRLVYSLLRFGLPVKNKKIDPEKGLAFAFLSDEIGPSLRETKKVMIGHDEGKITININEANDAMREKMRLDMNERYRTLLGHFRHEVGHYYWFLLIEDNPELLAQFRNVFGDERQDYDEMLKEHYEKGSRKDWSTNFISAYASSHPWEDWAESWAHYFHMADALETARALELTAKFKKGKEIKYLDFENFYQNFDEMQDHWIYLSTALNSLNRSMGMKDAYPFVWTRGIVEKLRFIQQLIRSFNRGVTE